MEATAAGNVDADDIGAVDGSGVGSGADGIMNRG